MKNLILALLAATVSLTACAQDTRRNNPAAGQERQKQETVKESPENGRQGNNLPTGDLYRGMTRKITDDRMITPYGIEVTFDKTVHLIFPSPIVYVDLGSANIVAGKADGAENILRVKAAIRDFATETNFSVVTDEGSFYSFNVKYADEPQKLNIEMKDFIHSGKTVNRPDNSLDIRMKELDNESPGPVKLIMKSIHDNDRKLIRHIGSRKFGIQFLLKGIYAYDGLLYLHTSIRNSTNIPYGIDFIRFKIVDKKVAKRTAVQETPIVPVRAYNLITRIGGKHTERTVFAIGRFTIPDGKRLVIDLYEKNGGRHQSFVIENEDLVRAERISELKIR
jgi:conjugative transposon TraN protein